MLHELANFLPIAIFVLVILLGWFMFRTVRGSKD